jgi:hypothetical protein
MTADATELARELVHSWRGFLENIDNHDDGEDLAHFIDLVDTFPVEVEPEDVRSSFALIATLNGALTLGLQEEDHQIVLDALTAAMRRLGKRLDINLPDVRPH